MNIAISTRPWASVGVHAVDIHVPTPEHYDAEYGVTPKLIWYAADETRELA